MTSGRATAPIARARLVVAVLSAHRPAAQRSGDGPFRVEAAERGRGPDVRPGPGGLGDPGGLGGPSGRHGPGGRHGPSRRAAATRRRAATLALVALGAAGLAALTWALWPVFTDGSAGPGTSGEGDGGAAGGAASGGGGGPPPATVTATEAVRASWERELSAIGTVAAVQGIDVTADIPGKIVRIAFEPGTRVAAGAPLVELDTATERAALRGIEARLEQASADRGRLRTLREDDLIAEQRLERSSSDVAALRAEAEQQRTLIAKKRIRAPFAGELGTREVSLGELVSPGTPIVSLQSLAPIHVDFEVPERELARLEPGQDVRVDVDAYPERAFEGRIVTIDPRIESRTRSVTVVAELPNADRALRPGMFADVTVTLGGAREVVTVPARAIAYNAYGESVFFVRPAPERDGAEGGGGRDGGGPEGEGPPPLVAERAFVRTGERRGTDIEVLEGVAPGERVVTAGQIKLDDGVPVAVSDEDVLAAAPGEGPAPRDGGAPPDAAGEPGDAAGDAADGGGAGANAGGEIDR